MTKLYLANCTKQIKQVNYRLPESRRVYETRLDPGACQALPTDMNPEQIEHFLRQHMPYGLRDEKTVKNVKEHVGLLYSIGKPVDMKRVAQVRERNDEVLTEQVDETLKQSLLAADHHVQTHTDGQGKVDTLEIIEQVPANERREGTSRRLKVAGRA
jgi:hypothetical protein